ncbi:MAG: hypothetical protein KGL39_09440 [Patescibacteria group bacterium]|nr:hypothetical protein [Patescibacteria group bacterium]
MAKKAAQAKYAATHKEAIKAKGVRYQPIANQRARERRRTDPQFKISGNLRKRIGAALSGRTKGAHTEKLTGCSYDYLLKWLEYQFTDGMTFENYGVAWEIDHVKPCTSFDLTDVKQQFECFNWKNLRPLDPSTNRSKNNQVIEEEIAAHNIVVESWLNLQN